MSVSQAFFFFLRLICVSDRNGLPFSVLSFLGRDHTPESVEQVGRVVGQFWGTVGRCELAVGGLEVHKKKIKIIHLTFDEKGQILEQWTMP